MKIVYFDIETYEEEFLKKANEGKYEYYFETCALNELTEIKPEYLDAEIISVFTTSRVSAKVLEKFKNLKLIALRSVGFNHIDLDYVKKHNIKVENSPNYGNITVAEFALALLLDVSRKVTVSYNEYKNAKVNPANLIGVELCGKTVGIVGLGAIGSAFAKIANGLSMNILAFDKVEREELKQKFNIKYTDFETLVQESDFISIHAPHTSENYHMFNEEIFNKMKSSAIIINTGRGELIDTQALYNALVNKKIAGAGLDVLEYEEVLVEFDYIGINRLDKLKLRQALINSRLFQLDNVIITPHTAYNSKEAINRILTTTMNNIDEFVQGKLQNIVE